MIWSQEHLNRTNMTLFWIIIDLSIFILFLRFYNINSNIKVTMTRRRAIFLHPICRIWQNPWRPDGRHSQGGRSCWLTPAAPWMGISWHGICKPSTRSCPGQRWVMFIGADGIMLLLGPVDEVAKVIYCKKMFPYKFPWTWTIVIMVSWSVFMILI